MNEYEEKLKVAHLPNPHGRSAPWEDFLEMALANSTPAEVVRIIRKIEGWLCGYCASCGKFNDTYKQNGVCDCPNKGFWNENP